MMKDTQLGKDSRREEPTRRGTAGLLRQLSFLGHGGRMTESCSVQPRPMS